MTSQWQSQIAAARAGESDSIQVTDERIALGQLADLHQVPDVTELLLEAGAVTDRGIEFIAPLGKLEHLRMRQSPLTDDGLAQLAAGSMENLRILNLPQAVVTAAGIKHLAALPNLVQLRLGGDGLDDRAAEAIAGLPALRSLHLIGPQLTDAGLDHLAKAPRLSSLYVDDCELSDEAWERLFAAKPNLHVHIDQAHHDRDPHDHPHR